MTRFLQSLLALIMLFQLWTIVQLGISIRNMDRVPDELNPDRIRDMKALVPDQGSSFKFEVKREVPTLPFTLGRVTRFDSKTDRLQQSPYLILNNTVPPVRMGDERYLLGSGGEKIRVDFDEQSMATGISIPEKRFQFCLFLGTALYLIVTIGIIWVAWQIFLFCRPLGKNDFFVPENRLRLKRLGWAVLVSAVIFTGWPLAMPMVVGSITGFSPWIFREHGSLLQPFWFIAGLLLLVIAEAFRKGNQLQTEQEFTI